MSIQIEATKQWSSSFPCTWICLLCYILCKIAVTFHWNGEVDPWSNWRKVQTSNTTKNGFVNSWHEVNLYLLDKAFQHCLQWLTGSLIMWLPRKWIHSTYTSNVKHDSFCSREIYISIFLWNTKKSLVSWKRNVEELKGKVRN